MKSATFAMRFLQGFSFKLLFLVNCTCAVPVSLVSVHRAEGQAVKANIIRVGPGERILLPSSAAKKAADGDTVEIRAADYRGDVAVWRQNNLTIRGIGGRPRFMADGIHVQGKGIWVTQGKNITIENIEFSGAKVPDRNGAAIRHQGEGLTIRHCYFHDNENGIMAANNPKDVILIEHTEFAGNGIGKEGSTHNVYIGKAGRLIVRFSYIHKVRHGHQIVSMARDNEILYNRIMDEKSGNGSYQIDFPAGGNAVIMGNVIQQGRASENKKMVSFGESGLAYPENELTVINNTFVNDCFSGTFVYTEMSLGVKLINNIFFGRGSISNRAVSQRGNIVPGNSLLSYLFPEKSEFMEPAEYNYSLRQGSKAIDGAVPFAVKPEYEYAHRAEKTGRRIVGKLDAGAFEFIRPSREN